MYKYFRFVSNTIYKGTIYKKGTCMKECHNDNDLKYMCFYKSVGCEEDSNAVEITEAEYLKFKNVIKANLPPPVEVKKVNVIQVIEADKPEVKSEEDFDEDKLEENDQVLAPADIPSSEPEDVEEKPVKAKRKK